MLYVFYNGAQALPDFIEYRLSDLFCKAADGDAADQQPPPAVEILVKVHNIRYNEDSRILARSRALMEYSLFIHFVKEALDNKNSLEEAITEAIYRSKQQGILEAFLKVHGTEVMGMFHGEVTWEAYEKVIREDAREEGKLEGELKGKLEGKLEGKRLRSLEVAGNMLKLGIAKEVIAEATELTLEEIEALKNH